MPEFFRTGQDTGYHTAMEWRSLSGGFLEPGPAKFWMRQLVPLVAGEEPSPLQRTLVIADVGNGISAVLDPREFLFINVDLTVHLERMPEGEWVCVDAVTRPRPNGIGSAESELSDRRGRIGRARPDPALRRALARPRRGARPAAAGLRPAIAKAIVAAATRAIAAESRKAPS